MININTDWWFSFLWRFEYDLDLGNVIVPVGYCPFGAYHHAEEYKSGQSGQKKSYGLQKAMIWGPLKRQHGHVSTGCGQN